MYATRIPLVLTILFLLKTPLGFSLAVQESAGESSVEMTDIRDLQSDLANLESEIEMRTRRGGRIPRDMEIELQGIRETIIYLKVKIERKIDNPAETAVTKAEVNEVRRNIQMLRERLRPAHPEGKSATIPEGSEVLVRLEDTLSTSESVEGQPFTAYLPEPYVVGTNLVLDAGTKIEGRIISVERPGRISGRAKLVLDFKRIYVGLQTYAIDAEIIGTEDREQALEGPSSAKKDAKRIGIGAGLGSILGAVIGGGSGAIAGLIIGGGGAAGTVLATRGDDLILPSNTGLWIRLASPLTVALAP